jgi:hypothetical protein
VSTRLRYWDVSREFLMEQLLHQCDGERLLAHDAPEDLKIEAIVQQTPFLYRLYVSSESFDDVGEDGWIPPLVVSVRVSQRVGPQDLI